MTDDDNIITARDDADAPKTEEQDTTPTNPAPDFVQTAKDPESGEDVRVLTMADASDPDKLAEALAATQTDDNVQEYDRDRMNQSIRERAVYLQGLDVRDPAISAPPVYLGV